MTDKHTRRSFVKGALAATGAASLAMSLEEQALLAQPAAGAPESNAPMAPGSQNTLPTGKLGDMEISRLIIGGNLIAGFAHSRDLMYVSKLLKHYFTEEKILETLQIAEAHG
ncbi:MAG: twin-arginine translocation signal domain-containing protein, partial [Phycisphaerae bacterium]